MHGSVETILLLPIQGSLNLICHRSFTSFKQAAQEAAISRFYGGIHYMPSINNGFDEGEKIAVFISSKIKTGKTGNAKND